jgi:hypothetical protein
MINGNAISQHEFTGFQPLKSFHLADLQPISPGDIGGNAVFAGT